MTGLLLSIYKTPMTTPIIYTRIKLIMVHTKFIFKKKSTASTTPRRNILDSHNSSPTIPIQSTLRVRRVSVRRILRAKWIRSCLYLRVGRSLLRACRDPPSDSWLHRRLQGTPRRRRPSASSGTRSPATRNNAVNTLSTPSTCRHAGMHWERSQQAEGSTSTWCAHLWYQYNTINVHKRLKSA